MASYNPSKQTIYFTLILFGLSLLVILAVIYFAPERRTSPNLTDMQFLVAKGIQFLIFSILMASCIVGLGLFGRLKPTRKKFLYCYYFIFLPLILLIHGITIYFFPHLLISLPYLYAMLGAVSLLALGMFGISISGWYNYIRLKNKNV